MISKYSCEEWYSSRNDLERKLYDCIIKFKETYFHVYEVAGRNLINISNEQKRTNINLETKEVWENFDPSPFNIGNLNLPQSEILIRSSKGANRRYRWGVNLGSCRFFNIDTHKEIKVAFSINEILKSLNTKYPKLNLQENQQCLSKNLSHKKNLLYFKFDLIGSLTEGKAHILPKFKSIPIIKKELKDAEIRY